MRESSVATVLNRYRHGETSLIFRLFSKEKGIFGAILKGGLKKKGVAEIGDSIEFVPARRGDEGLYFLNSFEIIDKNSLTSSLYKTAIRDTVFELTLTALHEEEPHLELFNLLEKFRESLKTRSEDEALFLLWLYTIRLGEELGFGFSLRNCYRCSTPLNFGGDIIAGSEGVICKSCSRRKSVTFSFNTLSLLATGTPKAVDYIPTLSKYEKLNITRALVDNLRTHFDFKKRLKALAFLETII